MLTKAEIQKIADEVLKELRSDFEEKVYQEAFLVELRTRGYEYDRERVIPVLYKARQVGVVKADVVARNGSEEVMLELKVSADDVNDRIKNELRAYLRAIHRSQPPHSGVQRKAFVVIFPCTSTKRKAPKSPERAYVEEVSTSSVEEAIASEPLGRV